MVAYPACYVPNVSIAVPVFEVNYLSFISGLEEFRRV
jgi:hypothetical protein